MSRHQAELSWSYVRQNNHYAARLFCATCPAHIDLPMGNPLPPEQVVKKFRHEGWEAEINIKRLCRCPECIAGREAKRKSTERQHVNGGTYKMTNAAHSLQATAPISQAVRTKIRELLDSHFDDSKGHYLDGYSDEVVAREATTNAVIVKGIREAAYGELKGDPELDELLTLTKSCKAQLDTVERRLGVLEQRLGVRR